MKRKLLFKYDTDLSWYLSLKETQTSVSQNRLNKNGYLIEVTLKCTSNSSSCLSCTLAVGLNVIMLMPIILILLMPLVGLTLLLLPLLLVLIPLLLLAGSLCLWP